MRRIVAILGFIAIVCMCMSAKTTGNIQEPDFAFPKKVQKQASSDLENALSAGDGARVVNALVRIGLAESAVSADSLPNVIARVEQVKSVEKNPVTRAMLCLLEAQIYADIYRNDTWAINQRPEISAQAVTDNYNLWGRSQFLRKVSSLIDEALVDGNALREVPLEEYSNTLTFQRGAVTVYPTLLDFAVYRALAYLEPFSRGVNRTLTTGLLSDPMDRSLYPTVADSVERRTLELYRMLMEGREESAPGLYARAAAMNYISDRIFSFERPVFSFDHSQSGPTDLQRVYMDV